MTLHIVGIDIDPNLARDHFWTSASDVLIDVANVQAAIGQAVHDGVAAGGDIEVTAHNEPERITITLVEPSGARQILFDNARQTIAHQVAA
jgi:hypothetical protein